MKLSTGLSSSEDLQSRVAFFSYEHYTSSFPQVMVRRLPFRIQEELASGFTGQSGHFLPGTCKEGLSLAIMQELLFKLWCVLVFQAICIAMSMCMHTITEGSINGSAAALISCCIRFQT